MELFDKHDRPILADMTREEGRKACVDFECYVHDIAESLSGDSWNRLIFDVSMFWDEHYKLRG